MQKLKRSLKSLLFLPSLPVRPFFDQAEARRFRLQQDLGRYRPEGYGGGLC